MDKKTNKLSGFSILSRGFTIIEILVVIAVIGILATIIMVSYSGITSKAVEVSLKTDLSNAYSTLLNYNIDHGKFPTVLDANYCPTDPVVDNAYCLKASPNNSYYQYTSDGNNILIVIENVNGTAYYITEDGVVTSGKPIW